ncbi:MAG: ABC transporter substrate-binding protein [Bacteroidia bacterium]|nr:ABC transporter substrate-binding protein [Bacteroidia bacterium]
MKRVLSIIPATWIFCILLFGISAPATKPAGLVAPPEGGKTQYSTENKYYNENIPPFRGAGGLYPQTPQGGLFTYDHPIEGALISYSPFEGGQGDVSTNNPIKIGLLIQTSSSSEATNGASIAIEEANNKGGYKGRKFELVVKSMEGPWGTGSKQAVDMIFNDEVIAIVGSHDGRNAHLVEQATTKSNVSFISSLSGDPTLSQAFTPWFFNCVPNDNQQADMLLREIARQKYSAVTLVSDDDYDAKSAFKSFSAKAPAAGIPQPVTMVFDKAESDMSEMVKMIINRKTGCLVLFTSPVTADKIICKLKEMNYPLQVYGPLSLLKENSPVYNYPEVMKNILILSAGDWFLKEKSDFARRYHDRFKQWPGAEAAYSYDAMMVIIKAAVSADSERDNMQKAIMETHYNGTTGTVRFDGRGNRVYGNLMTGQ